MMLSITWTRYITQLRTQLCRLFVIWLFIINTNIMLSALDYLPIDRVILNPKFFVIDGQKYDYMSIWFVRIVGPAVNFNVNLIAFVWIRNHYESHHLLLHIRPELWYLLLCGFHMQHIWVYDIMINWYWFSDQKQTFQFEKPRIWFETCDLEIIKGWTFCALT